MAAFAFTSESGEVNRKSSKDFSDLAEVVCNVQRPFPTIGTASDQVEGEEEEEDLSEDDDEDSENLLTDEEAADDTESGFLSQF